MKVAREFELEQLFDQPLDTHRLPIHRGLQLGRYRAGKYEIDRGDHRLMDGRFAAPVRRYLRDGSGFAAFATAVPATCAESARGVRRSMPGAGSSEALRVQADLAVGVKAAFRLQLDWPHTATHDFGGVHRSAVQVINALELRNMQTRRQRYRRAAEGIFGAAGKAPQQRARRAMRIGIELRPGTDQRGRWLCARPRACERARSLWPAALAAGIPAATAVARE